MRGAVPRPTAIEAALPLDDAHRFLRLLSELNHAIETCSKQMALRLGITFQQRTALRLVGRFPGITAGKLAETLHVDRGTLSATLGRLESKGLLERRPDPKDRRRVRLGLTSRGRALDVPQAGTVERAVERTLSSVASEQLSVAEGVVVTLIRQLEQALAEVRRAPRRKVFTATSQPG